MWVYVSVRIGRLIITTYAGMGKFSKNNEENNEAWDPAPEFIRVNDLVSEQGYKECGNSDDEHSGEAWYIIVHRV